MKIKILILGLIFGCGLEKNSYRNQSNQTIESKYFSFDEVGNNGFFYFTPKYGYQDESGYNNLVCMTESKEKKVVFASCKPGIEENQWRLIPLKNNQSLVQNLKSKKCIGLKRNKIQLLDCIENNKTKWNFDKIGYGQLQHIKNPKKCLSQEPLSTNPWKVPMGARISAAKMVECSHVINEKSGSSYVKGGSYWQWFSKKTNYDIFTTPSELNKMIPFCRKNSQPGFKAIGKLKSDENLEKGDFICSSNRQYALLKTIDGNFLLSKWIEDIGYVKLWNANSDWEQTISADSDLILTDKGELKSVRNDGTTELSIDGHSSQPVIGHMRVHHGYLLTGWTCIKHLDESLAIHIYDNLNNFIGSSQANLSSEQAVSDQCGVSGLKKYRFSVDLRSYPKVNNKSVKAYGIHSRGGSHSLLIGHGAPVSF